MCVCVCVCVCVRERHVCAYLCVCVCVCIFVLCVCVCVYEVCVCAFLPLFRSQTDKPAVSWQSLQSAQVWEHQEDGGTNQASPALTAAPVVSSDSHARGSEGYDFRHINHHMTLYLMMSVFDNDEEFRFKVKVSLAVIFCFVSFFVCCFN